MFDPIRKKIGLILSINDPRWGRGSQNDNNQNQDGKKPDGPPDLDELWRDLNQRLNKLFGGRGDNGGGSGSGPGMRGAGVGAFLVGIVVLFLWLASGIFIVQEGETAVVLTFGKYSYKTPTGINWRAPYPIQTHEIVNVSQFRTVEVGYSGSTRNKQANESLMLTDDENIVDIQFAVQYKVRDADKWLFNNREPVAMIKQVAESSIRDVVGKSKMDFVLYKGREKVASDVMRLMQDILDGYQSGVLITSIAMQGVQPPEQVQSAFDDVVKAGQDSVRQRNEGEAYAKDVILKADGTVSRLIQDAEGYRARVVATAQGDAARFKQVVAEYQKAPAVTRDRMYLDTMQQIFANTAKVMIDAKSGSNMLYLPLEKLISQTVAQDAGKANVAPAVTAAPPDLPDSQKQRDSSRSRDVRESRDREGR